MSQLTKLKRNDNITGTNVKIANPRKFGNIKRYPAIASFSELFNFVK